MLLNILLRLSIAPMQFVWCLVLVWPFLIYTFVKGLMIFKLRKLLHKTGYLKDDKDKSCNSSTISCKAASLILETSLVINCINIERDDANLPIAVFEYYNIHVIDMKGEVKVMNRCTVKIDLQNKILLSTNVDGTFLTPKQSYILFGWYLVTSHHAKVHSGK